jgi:hypothetical protein
MIGEVTAFLALGLLDRTGLFELKPPFLLRTKQEFPNCRALLDEKNVGRLSSDCVARYVNLCRLTGLAWTVWIGLASFALCGAAFLIYHSVRFWPREVFEAMSHPSLFLSLTQVGSNAYQLTCLEVWCAIAASAVLMTIYYSLLLASCRESEAKLRSAIRKPRKIAAAS